MIFYKKNYTNILVWIIIVTVIIVLIKYPIGE